MVAEPIEDIMSKILWTGQFDQLAASMTVYDVIFTGGGQSRSGILFGWRIKTGCGPL